MNKPTMHWSATLTALALTMTAPAFGQASTGDPFLDAMMQDQQSAQQETSSAAAPQNDPFLEAMSRKEKKAAAPVQAPAAPAPACPSGIPKVALLRSSS